MPDKTERWFGHLRGDDELRIKGMIERYGYARVIAAVIREMPKGAGEAPVNPEDLRI